MDFLRTVVSAGQRLADPAGAASSGRPRFETPRFAWLAPDHPEAPGGKAGHHDLRAADDRDGGGIGIDFSASVGQTQDTPSVPVESDVPAGDGGAPVLSDAEGRDRDVPAGGSAGDGKVGDGSGHSGAASDAVPADAAPAAAVATGFARLDAELPGGGWPRRALTELLLSQAGAGELRLLAPALRAELHAGRTVMLFDPPPALTARSLARLGLDAEHLLIVEGRSRALPDAGSLWALEQALRSGNVGAVVAWLPPRLAAERLRRLQVAAQGHDGAAFVLREAAVAALPTAAPLRVALHPVGDDDLTLRLLKRSLPASARPSAGLLRLTLPTLAAVPPARSGAAAGTTAATAATATHAAVPAHTAAAVGTDVVAGGEAASDAATPPSQGSLFASVDAPQAEWPAATAPVVPAGRPARRDGRTGGAPDHALRAAVFVDLAA